MAKFIDEREEQLSLQEDETSATFDDEDTSEEQEAAPSTEDDIPDKYQGKDIKEVVRMHQEAEKLLGRQSSEVGELRKVVDDFISAQLVKEQAHTSTDEQPVDFFEDPQKAVDAAIANHPKIKEAETVSQQLKRSEALAKLKTEHPDFEVIVRDQGFMDWVGKSKFRVELLKRADQGFDFDAADELLSSWKERQSVVTQAEQNEKQDRKRTVKKAATGNTTGSAESPGRKIYRRADIIKLMQTDPERYMSLAKEIRQAYAEGRVK